MVKAFDYLRHYQQYRDQYLTIFDQVLKSGQLILGEQVKLFEQEFAQACNAAFGVGVNSGTDALILALKALNVQTGDEVITVANTAVPTIAAIRATGAVPKFVDIAEQTLLINPDLIEHALTEKTKCIIAVHLYGLSSAMDEISRIAQQRNLYLIEDCAQAFGTTYKGKPVGSFGDIGCFSFYPTKNLGAFGDGGMCVTNNEGLAEKLRMLRMYGFKGDGYAHCEGINSRLDELQAAFLRFKLQHFSESLAQRRKIGHFYSDRLKQYYAIPHEDYENQHSYHLYVIRTKNRPKLIERLNSAEIGFGIHYPVPVHLMRPYMEFSQGEGSLPVTERAAQEILSLPMYPELTPQELDFIVAILGRDS